MKIIAMIPARLGSQRLKQKNLQLIHGEALIAHAIRKAKLSNVFDEICCFTTLPQYARSCRRPHPICAGNAAFTAYAAYGSIASKSHTSKHTVKPA